jgi:CRISPR-associated protein Csd1
MILQALYNYYDHLPDDKKPPLGFATHNVSFCLVLIPDGTLHEIEDIRTPTSKGKPIPVEMELPDFGEKRTSNDRPYYLWDKTDYFFGRGSDPKNAERDVKRFQDFRKLHLDERGELHNPAYQAFCRFLEAWDPSKADSLPDWLDIAGSNLVVRLRAEKEYLHKISENRNEWLKILAKRDTISGLCLVTGQRASIARLHPPIKKIYDPDGQAEKGIVTFNKDAFESYGKVQSYNAPISIEVTFKYSSALNKLLSDRGRRVLLGDTTCVFWTEKPNVVEDAFRATCDDDFWSNRPEENADTAAAKTHNNVRDFFNRLKSGLPSDHAADLENPQAPFYVLGLSPNASRISVRFWHVCTVGELAVRLAKHLQSLEMIGRPPDEPPLTIRRIIEETVSPKNGRPDRDKIAPQLVGDVARAVLTGLHYPQSLFNAVMNRIRTEGFVDREKRKDWRAAEYRRAAILKAWLIRNHRLEVPVSLDESRTDAPYLLGRLFAAYEKTQKDAQGENLNRTVKDSYLSAASATPASVFPRLFKLSQHHLAKLKADKPGLAVVREKLVGQIFAGLTDFPTHLRLQEQGLFAIGYYHQTQDFYTPKSNPGTNDSTENSND